MRGVINPYVLSRKNIINRSEVHSTPNDCFQRTKQKVRQSKFLPLKSIYNEIPENVYVHVFRKRIFGNFTVV